MRQTKKFFLNLPPEMLEAVGEYAKERGISKSDAIRQGIFELIRNGKNGSK